MKVHFDTTEEFDLHVDSDVSPASRGSRDEPAYGASAEISVFLGPLKPDGKRIDVTHMLSAKAIEALCERAIMEAEEASEPDPDDARDQREDR